MFEICLYKEPNINEIDMTSTITLFILTSLDPNETLNEYIGSLSKDFINLEFIIWYHNSLDNDKSSIRLECL